MSDLESLEMGRNEDSGYSLQLENRRRNVFVTQLGEHREEEDKDVIHIPIISEAPSKILETDANSLQKTLVLKKEVEVDCVTTELIAKRQEFKERMEAVAKRRAQLAKKQQDSRNQALKFDTFLKESDVKRRRAVQKYQAEVEMNEIKQREIDKLVTELEKLKIRQQKLQKKVAMHKMYEDFLLKIIDKLPDNYLECGSDSDIGAVIRRHETLTATSQTLRKNLISLSDDYEKRQHDLEALQREHDTTKLMLISELSDLQMKCNRIQEKNKQLAVSVNHEKGHFRYQSQELGSLLLAISNLAELCHMQHYGPLQEMGWLMKLDMIQEFILEKKHIQQLATEPADCGTMLSSLGDQTQIRKMGIAKEKFRSQVPALQEIMEWSRKNHLTAGDIEIQNVDALEWLQEKVSTVPIKIYEVNMQKSNSSNWWDKKHRSEVFHGTECYLAHPGGKQTCQLFHLQALEMFCELDHYVELGERNTP